MPQHARASQIETRTPRLKLPVARKPFWVRIGNGVSLGYRRNMTTGAWVARIADGKGGYSTKGIGTADDFAEADGRSVMDFWQAQDTARALAGRKDQRPEGDDGKPATVGQALDRYAADLKIRGGDPCNVSRIKMHLSPTLAAKTVAMLSVHELRSWRDGLVNKLSPASINRTTCALKAALNLCADQDERITKRHAWQKGLAAIPGAFKSHSVIVPEQDIRKLIACAYRFGDAFGLLVETAAVTGSRTSQLERIEVNGLLDGRRDPRLLVPSSHKGRARKASPPTQVPIPMGLAARLRRAAGDRPDNAPLLLNRKGRAWRKWDWQYTFGKAAKLAELDGVSIYALRHSAIVRDLLAGVPIRVCASQHDTSIEMIEQTYSKFITNFSEEIARAAMLDVDQGKVARFPVGERRR
jgi:integrase